MTSKPAALTEWLRRGQSTDMGMPTPGSCPHLRLQPASSSWTNHITSLSLSFPIYKGSKLSHEISKLPSFSLTYDDSAWPRTRQAAQPYFTFSFDQTIYITAVSAAQTHQTNSSSGKGNMVQQSPKPQVLIMDSTDYVTRGNQSNLMCHGCFFPHTTIMIPTKVKPDVEMLWKY